MVLGSASPDHPTNPRIEQLILQFVNIDQCTTFITSDSLFACQRIEDDSLHRASVTVQTSRLYLLQIRVRPGAAWLPDNSEPYRVHASEPPGQALAESSDEETVYL